MLFLLSGMTSVLLFTWLTAPLSLDLILHTTFLHPPTWYLRLLKHSLEKRSEVFRHQRLVLL